MVGIEILFFLIIKSKLCCCGKLGQFMKIKENLNFLNYYSFCCVSSYYFSVYIFYLAVTLLGDISIFRFLFLDMEFPPFSCLIKYSPESVFGSGPFTVFTIIEFPKEVLFMLVVSTDINNIRN